MDQPVHKLQFLNAVLIELTSSNAINFCHNKRNGFYSKWWKVLQRFLFEWVKGLKGFLLLKMMKFINTKMCTCLWLKWGHTIPYRAKAKKAVALCPLGSRHDLHWSREKGNEIFASSAFQYCTLGNFKFTFMPSSSLHYFFPCIMEWKMFFMLRIIQ